MTSNLGVINNYNYSDHFVYRSAGKFGMQLFSHKKKKIQIFFLK